MFKSKIFIFFCFRRTCFVWTKVPILFFLSNARKIFLDKQYVELLHILVLFFFNRFIIFNFSDKKIDDFNP